MRKKIDRTKYRDEIIIEKRLLKKTNKKKIYTLEILQDLLKKNTKMWRFRKINLF